MKNTMKEFRAFISKGNVVDMAIGVIVGGAFGKIVSSLVDDVIMPLLGILVGGIDFSGLFVALDGKDYPNLAAAKEAGAAVLAYGNFIQRVIDFLIIAFVIFMVMKQVTRMVARFQKQEEEAPTTRPCPFCLSPIPLKAIRCPHCTSEVAKEV